MGAGSVSGKSRRGVAPEGVGTFASRFGRLSGRWKEGVPARAQEPSWATMVFNVPLSMSGS